MTAQTGAEDSRAASARRSLAYYHRHRDKVQERRRLWRAAHRAELKAKRVAYRAAHPERHAAAQARAQFIFRLFGTAEQHEARRIQVRRWRVKRLANETYPARLARQAATRAYNRRYEREVAGLDLKRERALRGDIRMLVELRAVHLPSAAIAPTAPLPVMPEPSPRLLNRQRSGQRYYARRHERAAALAKREQDRQEREALRQEQHRAADERVEGQRTSASAATPVEPRSVSRREPGAEVRRVGVAAVTFRPTVPLYPALPTGQPLRRYRRC